MENDNFDKDLEVIESVKHRSKDTKERDAAERTRKGFFAPPPIFSCLLPILTVSAIILISLLIIHTLDSNQKRDVKIPSVIGLDAESAEKRIREALLVPEIVASSQYNEEIPENCVISTVPKGDRIVKEGRKVFIQVSKGSIFAVVPDVKGMPLSQATIKITELDILIGEITNEENSIFDYDSVISTKPAIGETVKRGSRINIVVSKGSANSSTASRATSETELVETPERTYNVNITLPHTADMKSGNVRIVINDVDGERIEYQGSHIPGSSLSYNVKYRGKAKLSVYFDNDLILERQLLES